MKKLTVKATSAMIREKVPAFYVDALPAMLYLACWDAGQQEPNPSKRDALHELYVRLKETWLAPGHEWLPKPCYSITDLPRIKSVMYVFHGLSDAEVKLLDGAVSWHLGLP